MASKMTVGAEQSRAAKRSNWKRIIAHLRNLPNWETIIAHLLTFSISKAKTVLSKWKELAIESYKENVLEDIDPKDRFVQILRMNQYDKKASKLHFKLIDVICTDARTRRSWKMKKRPRVHVFMKKGPKWLMKKRPILLVPRFSDWQQQFWRLVGLVSLYSELTTEMLNLAVSHPIVHFETIVINTWEDFELMSLAKKQLFFDGQLILSEQLKEEQAEAMRERGKQEGIIIFRGR